MTARDSMTVGILGVGRLAEFLVAGLCRHEGGPEILLSPRNAARAGRLAESYGLTIAGDNGELVAASDLVLLATRPDQAESAVTGLPWHADRLLIDLCAGVPLAVLAPHCGPVMLARAMPMSAAMIGESPTCLYPDLAPARALFSRLGPVVALPDEAAFEAASVLGAYYGWVHGLIGTVARWTAEAGVDAATARDLTAYMTRAAADMVRHQRDLSFAEIVGELATPGGITALGLGVLEDRAALEAWQDACEAVFTRLRAGGEDRSHSASGRR
jgi:pyrroline-5-carboxylate reductase